MLQPSTICVMVCCIIILFIYLVIETALDGRSELIAAVRKKLDVILLKLAEAGLVHGDLRANNIMVKRGNFALIFPH